VWHGTDSAYIDTFSFYLAATIYWFKIAAKGADGAAPTTITANSQSDTYTIVAGDEGKVVEMTKATASTLYIPTDATHNFAVGTVIKVCQYGAGQVTVAAVTPGTTAVHAPNGAVQTAYQYSSAEVRKHAANDWVLSGNLS
jgi:hypothetical protein